MENVLVRPASDADVETAIGIWQASSAARLGGEWPAPETVEMVRGWMRQPDASLLIAERSGQPIGMTLAMDARRDRFTGPVVEGSAHITMVYVVPEAWGQGVGAQMVDAMLVVTRERGYRHIELWTHETNERGRRLYVSRGFLPTGETDANPGGETIRKYARLL